MRRKRKMEEKEREYIIEIFDMLTGKNSPRLKRKNGSPGKLGLVVKMVTSFGNSAHRGKLTSPFRTPKAVGCKKVQRDNKKKKSPKR